VRLVFIHGRSQQGKQASVLRTRWESALLQGMASAGLNWPAGVEVAFPFFGDLLDDLVREVNAPLLTEVIARGGAADSPELQFRGELLREIADEAGITEAEISQHFAGPSHERGPLNWEWVHAMLQALDRTPLGAAAIDVFTRDVFVYLTYRAVQDRIDDVVSAQLTPAPCVVVAHSLGTIVGYNVLRNANPAARVPLFATVGSPLGIRAVRRRLDTPLTMPSCAGRWYNAFDERDVVALYPLDAQHFPISPAIDNNSSVRNTANDRHGIEGYLGDRSVATAIHHGLVGPGSQR